MIQGNSSMEELKEKWVQELSGVYTAGEAATLLRRMLEDVGVLRRGRPFAEYPIQAQQVDLLNRALLRLKRHEPWQYISGKVEFFNLTLGVNPSVLIPRPETEELVQWIADDWQGTAPEVIYDFGTGSGCIALAMKRQFPESRVIAWDVSEDALHLAEQNASDNALEVSFLKKDMLKDEPDLNGRILMVSNPPYLHRSEWDSLRENVRAYEPELALFVEDEDVLIHYKKLVQHVAKATPGNLMLYAEISEFYVDRLEDHLAGVNGIKYQINRDLSGVYRFLKVSGI